MEFLKIFSIYNPPTLDGTQEKKISENQILGIFNHIFESEKITPILTLFMLNFLALGVFGQLRGTILIAGALLATLAEKQSYHQLGISNALKFGLGIASLWGVFKAATGTSPSQASSKPQVIIVEERKNSTEKVDTTSKTDTELSFEKMDEIFQQVSNKKVPETKAETDDQKAEIAVAKKQEVEFSSNLTLSQPSSIKEESSPLSAEEKQKFEAVWAEATKETETLKADFKVAWKEAQELTDEQYHAFYEKLWETLTESQQAKLDELDEEAYKHSVKAEHREDFLQWLEVTANQYATIFDLSQPSSKLKCYEKQAATRMSRILTHVLAQQPVLARL